MQNENSPVLEIKNLNVWYGKQQSLFDLSLSIPEGKITALIGPSGCGKSTFLRSLNRMHDLDPSIKVQGEICFRGENLYDPRMDVSQIRKKIGMVFQRPNPFGLSIAANVAYGPKLEGRHSKKELDEIVIRSLRQAALYDEVAGRLDKPASSLSGGQQQRLCIARALANSPDVLLMDEPTSALDPIASRAIEELILSLKGICTIVIVTHNLEQARRIADQAVFFYQGRLIESGPADVVFACPKKQQTRDYISGRFS